MTPITIRIQENTKKSVDEEAEEYDLSTSEYLRKLIDKGRDYDDLEEQLQAKRQRIDDLERQLADRADQAEEVDRLQAKVDSLEARNQDLTNQLAESNRRIDTAVEIVEYVDNERSAQERYRAAGLFGKLKYTVFGMSSDDSKNE